MTPEDRAARAARLRELMSHDDVKDAIASVETDLIESWKQCHDPEQRERLWSSLNGLNLLTSKLGSWANHDLAALRRGR